ncbi:MAG: GNAT family N-acetyltransferase [Chloroflexi bacterium]|nr:GNAT family N-acetyltransferase [Chloroflexota bacterium]
MPIEYRVVSEAEFPEWRKAVRRGFNDHVHPDDIARLRSDRAEMDRLFGAFDGDRLVGTGGADSHMLTVPGGARLPTAGIAYIGSAATHRRQGVLTGMMRALLDQAREREEPLAALWASQAGIYSRFGFGPATVGEDWQVESVRSAFTHSPDMPGRVRFVEHDEALRLMPQVWDVASARRAGFLDRSERRWRYFFFDEERVRGGWSGMFHVVYEHNGRPEGYAAYRLRHIDPEDDPMDMKVIESVTVSDAAHAAVWRFLFDVDLVQTVRAHNRPPDDPVWWMLADPSRLRRTPEDGLWVRLADPARALAARGYGAEGRIVIQVEDRFRPDAGGVFELETSASGATCRRTTASPDVSLSASELGAAYLGGARLASMARAGRVEEHTDGALRLLDRMFAAEQAPWSVHYF